MGAFLYQNHHRHSLALFLRVLRRDRPAVGEELPFLVSVSSAGTSSQDVYANLSEIHPVDRRKEDLPSCPLISPYISKLVKASSTLNPALGFGELAGLPGERDSQGRGTDPGSRRHRPGDQG